MQIMGVTKAVNSSSSSHAALRNTLEYVLKESKTTSELKLVTGMYFEPEITADTVFKNFKEIRDSYGKDNGRMFKHFILSWSKDEDITPELGLAITNEWVEKIFPEFNALIVSHTDRDHVHCHVVVNSVNNVNGHKLNISNPQFQQMKDINDDICKQYGLNITVKGKHFDGTPIKEGTFSTFVKKTWQTLTGNDNKRKVLVDVIVQVLEVSATACSQEEFIIQLAERGITTNWTDNRKCITFTDDQSGIKIRDKKLGDTFTTELSKEVFNEAFIRNERIQRERSTITSKADRERSVLEEEVHGSSIESSSKQGANEGNDISKGRKSESKGTDSDLKDTELFIKRLGEELQDRMGWRAQQSRIAGTGANGSWHRRNKDSLSEREQYELRDLAEKLEDLRFYYLNNSYDIIHYTPYMKTKPDFYVDAVKNMERENYKTLLDYLSLMVQIAPQDLKMVNDERLSIRERVENRHMGEYHYSIGHKDRDEATAKEAYKLRDEAFSHVVTTLEKMEEKHPDFKAEREESLNANRNHRRSR